MKDQKNISISRSVGQFFGHLWGATTKPVDSEKSQSQVVNQSHESAEGELEGKKIVLRRTTIDEIEIKEE